LGTSKRIDKHREVSYTACASVKAVKSKMMVIADLPEQMGRSGLRI
jgi:hypothetical protein